MDGASAPVVTDPDLVFGSETSPRWPLRFASGETVQPQAARSETLTGCALASRTLSLNPGESSGWTSFFGQAPHWQETSDLRQRRS